MPCLETVELKPTTELKPELKPAIDLKLASVELEGATPQEILRWAVRTFHPRLTMSTAFGVEGCVLMSMLADIEPNVRVFNLDTGYQFPETLAMREVIFRMYGINIELVRPEDTVEQFEASFGGPLYNRDPNECCRLRKVVPLKRAVEGYDAWISSIRREQTRDRSGIKIVEHDPRFGLEKISPLANWTKKDVWRYVYENDVPYNPLADRGYTSIGCWPCTRPIQTGESERDGRWSGFNKTECGLHDRGSAGPVI